MSVCGVNSCVRPLYAKGCCSTHHRRLWKTGTTDDATPIRTRKSAQQRIEDRSSRIPFAGCQIWLGACLPFGYGVMHFEGRQQVAHRVAWQLAHGAIPDGLRVLHCCDVPQCVNVDHLFLGTDLDNVQDMLRKGRARMSPPTGDRHPMRVHKGLLAGERHGNAKLSQQDVQRIRDQYAAGTTQTSLASAFGVRQCHISRIVRNESWQA